MPAHHLFYQRKAQPPTADASFRILDPRGPHHGGIPWVTQTLIGPAQAIFWDMSRDTPLGKPQKHAHLQRGKAPLPGFEPGFPD